MKIEPVTLEGENVRLEPLEKEHAETLYGIGSDSEIWRWTTTNIEKFEDMEKYVQTALNEREQGVTLPFVTIDKASNEIVGSTRFGNISPENRCAEIGWTWINPKWQRTFINTEAKLLMLTHAFETWKCIRVEIITDVNNEKSRNAILRLGAKQEGILRNHLIVDSGRIRDSVVHSIIDSEWQSVKENLENKLRSY
jgi:RimJ/RimL family protein N-acetyltransferase